MPPARCDSAILCAATVAKWMRRWKPTWIPYGDNFQKAHVEWEQEVHTSDVPAQESGNRWKDPSTWSWHAHELSDTEIFTCLTRTDSKAKVCANPIVLRSPWISTTSLMVLSNLQMTDGTHQVFHMSSNSQTKLAADKPVVIEPYDEPAPSKPIVLEVSIPSNMGSHPNGCSDDEILSCIDENVTSIRHGNTAWAMSDPATTLERQMARNGCAKPNIREPYERSQTKIPFRQQRAKPFT